MILLKALYDLAEKQEENSIMDDINDYLKNRNCPEEYKIKLKPIKTDDEQFSILLNNTEKIDMKGHIGRNYEICKQRVNSNVFALMRCFFVFLFYFYNFFTCKNIFFILALKQN